MAGKIFVAGILTFLGTWLGYLLINLISLPAENTPVLVLVIIWCATIFVFIGFVIALLWFISITSKK